ncbi:MAG: hypothetical protein AAFQ22_05035 [Pseudomonadota bacterium]
MPARRILGWALIGAAIIVVLATIILPTTDARLRQAAIVLGSVSFVRGLIFLVRHKP